VAALYFPFETLDPDSNAEFSRRAQSLRTPPHNEMGVISSGEWICRLFFFAPDMADDLAVSASGTGGVVATEVRWFEGSPDEDPQRETQRLDAFEASVLRDTILRFDPWGNEVDPGDTPRLVMEFIEPDRYACLAMDRPSPQSLEHELLRTFCDMWTQRTGHCLEHIAHC